MKKQFIRLGKYLREKRVGANLSQRQVADSLGYSSPQFISNFERGLCAPPVNKLRILIKLYDLEPEKIVSMILEEQEKYLRTQILGRTSVKS